MGLAKSIGIPMLIDIFYFFSKTVSQIHFKHGGEIPWMGAYYVCSYGHALVILAQLIRILVFQCIQRIDHYASQWGLKVNRDCNAN